MSLNKPFLTSLAASLILIFHLWANFTSTVIENFIIRSAYIGVDIFFFVSAYNLAGKVIDYKSFLKNRFIKIYGKFFIFTIIASFYKHFSLSKTLQILLGIELLTKGGGSFLWYLAAIMIFYMIYPLFCNWQNQHKISIVLLAYLIIALSISLLSKYSAIFIFLNRIPLFLTAYYLKTNKINISKKVSLLLLVVGLILLYLFSYKSRLNYPIKESFYIVLIPLIVSIVYLSQSIHFPNNLLGSISLELYGVQMIFGQNIAIYFLSHISNILLANLLTILIVIILTYLFNLVFNFLYELKSSYGK